MKRPETFRRRKRTKAAMKYLAVLFVILLVAGFQDRIYPELVDFPVLERESAFFSATFIQVFPIAWVCALAFSKLSTLKGINPLFVKRLAFLLVSTCLQLLVASVILYFVIDGEISFGQTLAYLASQLLYQYLLVYSVVAWVLVRREKSIEPNSQV